jgi:hypothetical protein
MADKAASDLTSATAAAVDAAYIVQGGNSRRTTVGSILDAISAAQAAGILNQLTAAQAKTALSIGDDVASFLATPTSANLASALSDESGTGVVPFLSSGTWTPVITFDTPGNLSVTYSTQSGTWARIGNQFKATCALSTSGLTLGTASGNLRVSGLPVAPTDTSKESVVWSGITKANYTQVNASTVIGQTYLLFNISGSGQSVDVVDTADVSGNLVLSFTIHFTV